MPFKKSEPGCKCCGIGLVTTSSTINLTKFEIAVLGPYEGNSVFPPLMRGNRVFRTLDVFGVGSRTIGMDPERGRLLIRVSSGAIHYYESGTNTSGVLWNSSTDIASISPEYIYYQHSYGYAGGFTDPSTSPVSGFVIDDTGTFTTAPFDFDSGTILGSVAVDPDGNLFCGQREEVVGAVATRYVLKNGVDNCFASYTSGDIQEDEIVIDTNTLIHTGTHVIVSAYRYKAGASASPTRVELVKAADGAEFQEADTFASSVDITGQIETGFNLHYKPSAYIPEQGYLDIILDRPAGHWRITEDLSVNTYMQGTYTTLGSRVMMVTKEVS